MKNWRFSSNEWIFGNVFQLVERALSGKAHDRHLFFSHNKMAQKITELPDSAPLTVREIRKFTDTLLP